MYFPKRLTTQQGFTLIELSSVILIIMLLAAILFPVFAQARAKAQQANCLSNIKQLGLAHMMYWEDYDGMTVTSWSFGFPGEFSWYVQPYLKNYAVLHCPSFPTSAEAYGRYCNPNYLPGNVDNPTGEEMMWGYGYNTGHQWINDTGLTRNAPYHLSGTYTVDFSGRSVTVRYRTVPLLGIPVSAIAAPANVVMLGDSSDTVVAGLGRWYLRRPTPNDDACARLRKFNWPRHGEGNNAVYADGHAAWYAYNDTLLADGDPSVLPNVCSYFSMYDGSNNPGNCQARLATP
jgi:prepilin-type processing-associated H-X9-DG protein/prepilin-type N-terminal cleavage/methylation domain-containing protein